MLHGDIYDRCVRVAEIAKAAHLERRSATEAVAAELQVDLRRASRLMSIARAAGFDIPMSRPADTPGMRRSIEALKAWRMETADQSLTYQEWDKDGWRDRANCKGINANLFFPERGDNHHDINAAKRVCHACEVREQCLEYALVAGEKIGIWGGMSERERRHVRRSARYELLVVRSGIA